MIRGLTSGGQRHLSHMHFQDLLAAQHVGVGDHHLAVEAAGAEQRRIEHVRAVGRRDQDHPLIRLEPVHLDEELIQGLLAFVIAAAEPGPAMPPDGVDLVDEDDAGRVLLALLEHVAHPARADADEHLDEIGARNGEERHVRLARDGAREQGLAGPGRPDQQDALRDLAAEALEFLRVLEEIDDFLELLLGLVDAGHVLEGHPPEALGQKPRAGLAETHRLAAAGLHLAHEEYPHADQQQHREPRDQDLEQRRRAVLDRQGADLHAARAQPFDELRIVRRIGLEGAFVAVEAGDLVPLDGDFLDLAALDLGKELGERDPLAGAAARWLLEQVEQRHQQEADDHPERKISTEIAQAPNPESSGRGQPPASRAPSSDWTE